MSEGPEHKALKTCASRIFGGSPERQVDGRVDVKSPTFCVEVETTGRTDRLQHAIEKLSSSPCGGGFLVVPDEALPKAMKLTENSKSVISVPGDRLKRLCRIE